MDTNTKGYINKVDINDKIIKEENDNLNKTFNKLSFKDSYRNSEAYEIIDLFTEDEIENFLKEINELSWQAVGIDGIASNYKDGDTIGSYRLSVVSNYIAERLYNRLINIVGDIFEVTEDILTDAENNSVWEFKEVNPLFRFIRYGEGGLLVPHYDGSYKPSDDYRSLKTIVIYLEGEEGQGSTRFIKDDRILNSSKADLDRSDWTRLAKEDEIIYESVVKKGKVLVFDHWMLHDSEPLNVDDKVKTIIRTDMMYRRIK